MKVILVIDQENDFISISVILIILYDHVAYYLLFSFTEPSQTRTGKEATKEIPNSPKAQMEQVDLSNDVGMKCSQI